MRAPGPGPRATPGTLLGPAGSCESVHPRGPRRCMALGRPAEAGVAARSPALEHDPNLMPSPGKRGTAPPRRPPAGPRTLCSRPVGPRSPPQLTPGRCGTRADAAPGRGWRSQPPAAAPGCLAAGTAVRRARRRRPGGVLARASWRGRGRRPSRTGRPGPVPRAGARAELRSRSRALGSPRIGRAAAAPRAPGIEESRPGRRASAPRSHR